MTSDEIKCFKDEMRMELRDEVRSNFEELREEMESKFGLMKWIMGLLIVLFLGFVGSNIVTMVGMKSYVTQTEFSIATKEMTEREERRDLKLKEEITKKFSLPVQLVMVQQKQIKAMLIDKDVRKYQQAKEEEERLNIEILKLNYDLTTRGGN